MDRGKSESLREVASSLAAHLRSGGDISEFDFEPRKIVHKSWPPDSFDFKRQQNESFVFIGFPYFQASVDRAEIRNSIFVDCDLSGLGRPRSRLDSVLVLGTGTASVCAPAVSSKPIKVRVHAPDIFKPKNVQVKLEDLRSDLRVVAGLDVFQPLKLGRTSTCRARGIDLSHCEVCGEAVFSGVDLTAATFYHADIKGKLVLQDCWIDGIDLRSIEVASDARLSLVSNSADMLSIERLALGTSTSEAQGQVLLQKVKLANSQIGEDSIGSSPSWVSLAEGTFAEFVESRLLNTVVDLTDLKGSDELILSKCELDHLTLKGLGTTIRLKDCRGELLLKGCKGANLFISGESEALLSINFEDCQSINIISESAASLALSLVRTTLGKKIKVVGSRSLEFMEFDAASAISIDDPESSLSGSTVKGLRLQEPGQLVFRSVGSRLDLTGTTFDSCILQNLSLSQCRIEEATFLDCDLTGSTITGSNDCKFQSCNLSRSTITDAAKITLSGSRSILTDLKLPDEKLQGFVLVDIPPDQISGLKLNNKHLLNWRVDVDSIPDLELSGTILDCVELSAKSMKNWSLRAKDQSTGMSPGHITGSDRVHLRGSTRLTNRCEGKAVFFGCSFEAEDFWKQSQWGSLEFTSCEFGKGVVKETFPWTSVIKITDSLFNEGSIQDVNLSCDFARTRFDCSGFRNVMVSGKGKSVDLAISRSKILSNVQFADLSKLDLRVIKATDQCICSGLHIRNVEKVHQVLLEDINVNDLSVAMKPGSDPGDKKESARVALRGTSGPIEAKDIEFTSLDGASLQLEHVKSTGLRLINCTLAKDSSAVNVDISGSSIQECNLLDLDEGQLNNVSFKEGCSFRSIRFTESFGRNIRRGVNLAGGQFVGCDFTKSDLKAPMQERIDLHDCSFDNDCDFSGMEVVRVNFDGCLKLAQKLDRTTFRECSFKGANFSTEERRIFWGVSCQNCEFDGLPIGAGKTAQFSRCEFHGPKGEVFCTIGLHDLARTIALTASSKGSLEKELLDSARDYRLDRYQIRYLYDEILTIVMESNKDADGHQTDDQSDSSATIDIDQVIAEVGTEGDRTPWFPRFNEVKFCDCLLSGIDFSGSTGSIELERCRTKGCTFGDGPTSIRLEGGSLERTKIDTSSLKTLNATLTLVRDLTIDDRSRTGRFTFIQCPDIVMEFTDRRFTGVLEMVLCKIERLSITRHREPGTSEAQTCVGSYILDKCRLQPADPRKPKSIEDSLTFSGFDASTPSAHGQVVQGRLYGNHISPVIRRVREMLGDKCVDLPDYPDSHWAEVISTLGLENETTKIARPTLQDIAERMLLRLPRHFDLVWQNSNRAPEEMIRDLGRLKSTIVSAAIPPGVFVPEPEGEQTAQERYDKIRTLLYGRISDREQIAEGRFGNDQALKNIIMSPKYYIELISELLSMITLNVGRHTSEGNTPEPKTLLALLREAVDKPLSLGEPLPDKLPIDADTARIYLDTTCFSRLIMTKIGHNIEVRAKQKKCWINFMTEQADGSELLCVSISDKGPGFRQSVTYIVEKILNDTKYEETRAFASRFCTSLSVVTTCSDGYRRSFAISKGEREFCLEEDAHVDQGDVGTAYVFRFPICR